MTAPLADAGALDAALVLAVLSALSDQGFVLIHDPERQPDVDGGRLQRALVVAARLLGWPAGYEASETWTWLQGRVWYFGSLNLPPATLAALPAQDQAGYVRALELAQVICRFADGHTAGLTGQCIRSWRAA